MESDKIICVMKICSMERFTVYGKKTRGLKNLESMRTYRMKYSMKPRERIYVKSYGYLCFAKNMSKT